MKCDELKPIELECNMGKDINGVEHREPWKAYDIDEVDAAIAELKDKCKMHDFFWEGCGFAKRGFKNTIAVSEAFDRLEAENAELKKKLMPCLNGDCILTCEVVEKYGKENAELKQKLEDASMRERKLKRGLWHAREWRAWCEEQFWLVINDNKPRDIYHLLLTNRIHRTPSEWIDYWYKVEQLCGKKAEEYK